MNVISEKTTEISETIFRLSLTLELIQDPTLKDAIQATIFRLCSMIDANTHEQMSLNNERRNR